MTSMTIEGGDTFQATLGDASNGIEDLSSAKDEAGRIVAQRAAAGAPKLTGTLARSIRPQTDATTVSVGTDLVYGAVQEYGSPGHNIAAHPYMRPALADSQSLVVAAYARDVQTELGHVRGA